MTNKTDDVLELLAAAEAQYTRYVELQKTTNQLRPLEDDEEPSGLSRTLDFPLGIVLK